MPQDWDSLCRLLEKEYRATYASDSELLGSAHWRHIGLPIPLILNAWVFAANFEKLMRWQETIAWAEENNLLRVIENTEFRKHWGE